MNTTTKAILASVAVLALCLCAVGGVTYSWFSDSEQTDIDITTGTIELDMSISNVTVQSYGGEPITIDPTGGVITDLGGIVSYSTTSTNTATILTISFQNAAPGDSIKFDVSGTLTNSIDATYHESYSVSGPALTSPFTIDGLSISAGSYAASTEAKTLAEKTISVSMDTTAGNEYQGAKFEIVIVFEAIQENAPQTPSITTDIETGSNSVSVNNSSGESATIQFDNSGNSPVTGTLSVSMVDVTDSDYAVTDGTVLAGISVTPSEGGSNLDGIATTVTFQIDGDLSATNLTIYHDGTEFTPTGTITKTYDETTGKTTVSFVTSSGFSSYVVVGDILAKIGDSYYSDIDDAINAATAESQIMLVDDLTLTGNISPATSIVIPKDTTVIIDLAGHSVISSVAGCAVINYGTLTLKDSVTGGSLYTTDISAQGRHAVVNYGVLVIESGTYGSDASRGNAVRNFGTTTITGGEFTACDNYTNGGYAYAIANGGSDYPDATMTIEDASVSGSMNGVLAADSGTLTINDGTYILSQKNTDANVFHMFYTSGDGKIIVNDGTFARVASSQSFYNGSITINGGIFAHGTGSTSADPSNYLSEGCACVYKDTTVSGIAVRAYTVIGTPGLDLSNITTSDDFLAALQLVKENGTITLQKDIIVSNKGQYGNGTPSMYCLADGVTLDLNGHKITVMTNNMFLFCGNGTVVKDGTVNKLGNISYVLGITSGAQNAKFENLTVNGGIEALGGGASLTLSNVTSTASNYYCVYLAGGATVTIESGSYTPHEGLPCFYTQNASDKVIINGGTTSGTIHGGNGSCTDNRA